MFEVKNLNSSIAGKKVLKDINLQVKTGEVLALLGKNGSGKTTFAQSLLGSSDFETSGEVIFAGLRLDQLTTDERSRAGLYVSFQAPPEITGVGVAHLIKTAMIARFPEMDLAEIYSKMKKAFAKVGLPWEMAERSVNDGFSGGERKRLELVQAILYEPRVVVLDEIDSGLDNDGLLELKEILFDLKKDSSIIIISHNLSHVRRIEPDKVMILSAGQISSQGGIEILDLIEKDGFGNRV